MQIESIEEVFAPQRRNAQSLHDIISQAIQDRLSGAIPEPDFFHGGDYFGYEDNNSFEIVADADSDKSATSEGTNATEKLTESINSEENQSIGSHRFESEMFGHASEQSPELSQ